MVTLFLNEPVVLSKKKWLHSSIWHINGTLKGIITPGQRGHGSNGNERVHHIPQSFGSGTLSSDAV